MKVLPQEEHGLSEYGISREHLPQSMRVAHTACPAAAAGQSEAAWQVAHGWARPQHGKRSQRYECLKCLHAPLLGSGLPTLRPSEASWLAFFLRSFLRSDSISSSSSSSPPPLPPPPPPPAAPACLTSVTLEK